ncbi:MAG: UDP-N-acetylmuramate dehydrogenase [Patescibacteria group bacterium]|nr:UDP-N-acetylmuramate dehydrogenase [Patescibacteria group bacterium]
MDIKILENIKLSDYTTFKIGGLAKYFVVVKSEEELFATINWANKKDEKIFVLGGGSNLLFSDDGYDGLVIKNEIKGLEIVSENESEVIVRVYSGEIWSKLVYFTIENGLYGLENTFYIPGTVGASPIQNIGAYGTEIKDVFYNLKAVDIKTGEGRFFNLEDCNFSYRDSVFKKELKGKYFILWVEFKLSRSGKLNLNYPDVQRVLEERGIKEPSLRELTEIIREIRDSKLPNPAVLANAGSFFKNPIINPEHFKVLKEKFPDIKSFVDEQGFKIPAGWLIEQCGFKGKTFGPVGIYEKQALIIVNHGGAKQKDVLGLVENIKQEVKNRFDIDLEEEVNVL